jgi:hypothetical protein
VRLRPFDWLMVLYNVVLAAVWLPLASVEPAARWLLAVHLAALAVPVILLRSPRPLSRVGALLRVAYPLLWLSAFWRELDIHAVLVGSAPNDAAIQAVEVALFHGLPSQAWMPAMHGLAFSELMEGFYFAYYVLMVAVPVWCLLRSRDEGASTDVVLRLSLAYVVAFIPFALAPTASPLVLFPRFMGENAHGLFRVVNDFLEVSGDSAGTGFPSSHVTAVIGLAWVSWRHLPRPFAWVAAVIAAGVVPATVYTQNHFVVDALAGAVLGIGTQLAVEPVLGRLRGMRPARGLRGAPLPRAELEAA